MHPYIYSSIIYNSQIMEVSQVPIDRWMDKGDVANTYHGILFSHKKEWNLAICNDTDGARKSYAKQNKSVRKR